jgi:hypothetical protein
MEPKRNTKQVAGIMGCKRTESGGFILPPCRLQYPSLDKPSQYQGDGPAKFRATFIFTDDADLSELEAEIDRLKKEAKIRKQNYEVIRDDKDNADAGFGIGTRFIGATSGRAVPLIDTERAPCPVEFFYPGAIVRPMINLYVSSKSGPARVNAGLQMIQFLRDGEQLRSGGSSDPNDFEDVNPDEVPF